MNTSLSQASTKAVPLPSDALVTQCKADPCAAAWASIDADVKDILHLKDDSRDELVARNKRISSAYAGLFLSQAPGGPSTDVRFIGAAAFGSKQVGCGMANLRYIPTIEFNRLAAGNAAIFESFYPASRFYAENINKHGKDWVQGCLGERYPPDPLTGRKAPVTEGIGLISEGKIKDGVMTIVRHEQGPVLANSMYALENEEFPGNNAGFFWAMSYAVYFGQFEAVYAAGCSALSDKYIVEYPGWTISFADRMRFFEQSVDKFNSLWISDRDYMMRELQKIRNLSP